MEATLESLSLTREEKDVVAEVLASEQVRLAVEIRHTDKRAYREELKHRINLVEALLARIKLGEP